MALSMNGRHGKFEGKSLTYIITSSYTNVHLFIIFLEFLTGFVSLYFKRIHHT